MWLVQDHFPYSGEDPGVFANHAKELELLE